MAQQPSGIDFNQGVAIHALADHPAVRGHADGEPVLMVRSGDTVFAIGADCTHYGAPLEKGLISNGTIRCPWHHACFSLRTGAVIDAPALDALATWNVEQRDGKLFINGRKHPAKPAALKNPPSSIVIIGGGAAGEAAAETLRHEGYQGRITILSADPDLPPDRTTLSKSFLNGSSGAETIPLRDAAFFTDHAIDLVLNARVNLINTADKQVMLTDGISHPYDALLIATGAMPARLDLPGGDLVHYLRTVADGRNLDALAVKGARAVVIGSSFIGMEVAASLRQREIEVLVVSQESKPMATVLGANLGAFFQTLHEDHGVAFRLEADVASVTETAVILASGEQIPADFVVAGIGVAPLTELAADAGITVDHGVMVDAYLQTSTPGIYAAGDIARWPDPHTGKPIRVEHWAVAQRQGQVAARNMLGRQQRFDQLPFFWTGQYDVSLRYVGHATDWDEELVDGAMGNCTVTYRKAGKPLAIATLKHDKAALDFVAAYQPTHE
ncbi:MAG: pyridine nucleotide-disulfide oxidoreductase [Acidiphilium sp. 37-64-53]|uniref:FAD-dependent oxidoreductase n=1 Tax=Acidiphilium TaxID=522 RepID=UPI000BD38279|nr:MULTISPECIES: FAD-dependent oxidoreductase [Acidiphilium]OYW03260.1 MAG: pyridine nucleotide-disulfide oxidoreductase [Acidiphilium sp. 37-64-53]OZB30928.1 MAG: pyridine nucleotide-disulfide oxidoreductase [Acidiphilium sp. 34-64-41]HQT83966.1 FAD-dependent oxidoreductase [Acidiphilium rubrum]